MPSELKFAVLIDADNISSKYIRLILDELSNEGISTYKRIYGDWTSPSLASWKPILLDNSIIPIQQYSYTFGKNATDSAMIIDAMDILYSGQVDGFCLASSDSDFTRLAARLRESGMQVIGMGESKTPKPFIAACNQFKYLDILWANSQKAEQKTAGTKGKKTQVILQNGNKLGTPAQDADAPLPQTNMQTIKEAIQAIAEECSDEEGWLFCGQLGALLAKRYPDFDVRNYGFAKFTPFLESLSEFELKRIPKGNIQLVYIRCKDQTEDTSLASKR